MTESKNEQGSEPGRPSWAAGLDLSKRAIRPTDETIKAWMRGQELVLRRLADAEMRVAELEQALSRAEATTMIERGEPDYLIDRHGDCWFRMESGGYAMQGEGEAPARSTIEIAYGPTTEAWK